MTPRKQLDGFIAKFTPQVAGIAHEVLEKMRLRLPGAVELVYDNYNALAVGFAPGERSSEGIFSIVLFPRWVTLFFLQGAKLPDPKNLLRGEGKVVRHIVLEAASDLEMPGIRALMSAAIKSAKRAIDPAGENRIVIRAVLKKQRPRRPAGASAAPVKAVKAKHSGRRPK